MHDFGDIVQTAMVFAFILGVIWLKQRNRLEERKLDRTSQAAAEKSALYANHNADLEQRVRVLERIVTDKGYDVATQIEALRDQQRIDDRMGQREPVE
ncbi:hypothetical protein [Tsuneonella mangrovi]|uniref:hypothetical protein n=1 Tax=Tsuneonella mangrovi TaxID=1982042 RepID=UPI001F0A61E0|nr:hypothetical protein [Tsuneonella mangrovi]